jgi:HSP20 family molecular chaperone IbpA
MYALMPRLLGEMTDWFELDLPARGSVIRVEDLITEHEYKVRAELPGIDPDKDVQISVANGILTIHAERKEETQVRHRSEFRYGVFQRSVRLPNNVDEDAIKAAYGKGILEITVPLRATEPAVKQVTITQSE